MKKLISVLFIIILLIGCGGSSNSEDPYPPSPIFKGEPFPSISINPESVVFYTTGLNRISYYLFTITNNGEPKLVFDGEPTTDNPAFVFDRDESDLLNPLAGGESIKILVYFNPTEWNTEYDGNLTIKSNDPYRPILSIPLRGKSQDITPTGEITVDGVYPDGNDVISIMFPAQYRCTGDSKAKVLIVTNNGTVDDFFFRIEDPSNSQYSVYLDGNKNPITDSWYITSPLDIGQTATLYLVFHPDDDYNLTGWVWTMYTNDPDHPIIKIDVSAVAIGTCG